MKTYSDILSKFITKNWSLLHIIFLVIFSIYKLIEYKSNSCFIKVDSVNPISLILFVIALSSLLFFSKSHLSKIHHFWVLNIFIYLLIVLGYIIQIDPNLQWEGSDVASGNYKAAQETAELGPLYIIKTWNNRANPYAHTEHPRQKRINKNIREYIAKNNLDWLIGKKWNNEISYSADGNIDRAYTHPPLTPILTGLWLNVFPEKKLYVVIFIIVLHLLSISILYYSFRNFISGRYLFNIILLLTVSPVFLKYTSFPSAEPLTLFLTTISVLCLFFYRSKWYMPLFAGITIGLAFFSKFSVAFYIIVQGIFLLFYSIRNGEWKSFAYYLTGFISINLLFFLMNYNFILTYITGKEMIGDYINMYPQPFYKPFIKLLYIGPGLILLFVLFIQKLKLIISSQFKRHIFFALISGIVILFISLFKLAIFNRFILIFVGGLAPFLISLYNNIPISQQKLNVSISTNIAFFLLLTYF